MKDFRRYVIGDNISCIHALKILDTDDRSQQTLFVVDYDEKLIGTVTDGDIRRGLLKGFSLESPISLFIHKKFSFLNENISVEVVRDLRKAGIRLLPKLDKSGKIERVYDLGRLKSILPLHAVIMAGGRGERLRPLTDTIPKPMLKLGNKPIIEHNIDHIISYGIETISISVGYLSKRIIDYFGEGDKKEIKIDYIQEDTPRGTIGSIADLPDIKQEVILVLNSDLFTNIDFEDFFLSFETSGADMAVASIPYTFEIPYAILELEEDSIVSFMEKPKKTYYANAGIYLIRKECLTLIPKGQFFNATDLMKSVLDNRLKLIHSPITGYWIDIGKQDDFNKAKELIKHIK